MKSGHLARLGLTVGVVVAFAAIAERARAVPQFEPPDSARLHTFGNGPGTSWNTGADGATGGQIQYDSGTNLLTLTGGVDVLHYFDPNDGSCPTDTSGSDCSHNFVPNLDLSVTAQVVGIDVEEIVPATVYELTLNLGTLGTSDYDILWTDPTDGDSEMLRADWVGGFFDGQPTTGLQATLLYNASTETASASDLNIVGFFTVDPTSPYEHLFASGGNRFGLDVQGVSNFSPTLSAIAKEAFENQNLLDFTADGAGQVFRVSEGDFIIPEPATGLLVGMGLVGLGIAGRRRS